MRKKLMTIACICLVSLGGITSSRASQSSLLVVGDVVLGRPGCFLATVFGSVVFVAALPFAATSGSVKETAHVLVVRPAQATFTRPLGDFDSLTD